MPFVNRCCHYFFRMDESWALCTAPSSIINFPNPITIQRDTPVGSVLATANVVTTISCDGVGNTPGAAWNVYLAGTNVDQGASSIANVRLTEIPGIGIRWHNLNSFPGTSQYWTSGRLNDTARQRGIAPRGTTIFTDTFELIKLGSTTSSVFPSRAMAYRYRNLSGEDKGPLYNQTVPNRNIQTVACSVLNSSIVVSMGIVSSTDLRGIGNTHPNEQSFSIPLNCDAATRVKVTLAGTRHSSNAPGVLALSSSSETVATGVGLQLLYNGMPVVFDTLIPIGTAASDGAFSIPLVARYYQTAAAITDGLADSTATFTMTYN